MVQYLYISISRETQNAKGREALTWIVPQTPKYFASQIFKSLKPAPDTGVEHGSLSW